MGVEVGGIGRGSGKGILSCQGMKMQPWWGGGDRCSRQAEPTHPSYGWGFSNQGAHWGQMGGDQFYAPLNPMV